MLFRSEQVLINLAVNARDAMPQGGVIQVKTGQITVANVQPLRNPDARPGQFVCLTVTDAGCGMTQDTILRIFDPFFTTKEVGKGSGMGLSMVMGFVHQSRRHVTISSEPDVGTTVKLYFPRVDTSQRSEQCDTAKGQSAAGLSDSSWSGTDRASGP